MEFTDESKALSVLIDICSQLPSYLVFLSPSFLIALLGYQFKFIAFLQQPLNCLRQCEAKVFFGF